VDKHEGEYFHLFSSLPALKSVRGIIMGDEASTKLRHSFVFKRHRKKWNKKGVKLHLT